MRRLDHKILHAVFDRPLKRLISHKVETALSKEIIRGEAGDGDTIKMGYDGTEFIFEKA